MEVADELQTEFIYEHLEGEKVVASMGVRPVRIKDDVVGCSQHRNFMKSLRGQR